MATTQRIVSLLPSSTEMVCALGLAESLVGISHACDYPLGITGLPRLTTPKINSHADSRTIDRDVRALVHNGLGIYHIDTDLLLELRPDLIITQDQCDVCAVPYATVLDATRVVLGTHVEVLSLQPSLLQDIWDDIRRVGAATGCVRQAGTLLEALFTRVKAILAESTMIPELPRVAVMAWIEPLILAGNWMPELIQLAGGMDALCTPGAPAQTVTWQTIQECAPEVLAVIPCGYKLPRTLSELPTLQGLPGWQDVPAVRQGQAYVVDGNAYFHRAGPRIVDSLEMLAGLIHPELFGEHLPPEGEVYQRLA